MTSSLDDFERSITNQDILDVLIKAKERNDER